MSWEQEEISRLKDEAATTKNKITLLMVIDKLGEFAKTSHREQAIDVISSIVASQLDKNVKVYALEVIKQMREGNTG